MNIAKTMSTVGKEIVKLSPMIMTGAGCIGVLTAGALAVKATPKALRILDDEGYELRILDEYEKAEDRVAMLKAVIPQYLPAIAVTVGSIALIIGGMALKHKQYTAMLALYALNQDKLDTLKDKVKEVFGEEGTEKLKEATDATSVEKAIFVDDSIDSEVASALAESTGLSTIMTDNGPGKTLCMDVYSGRMWYSSMEDIRRAENDVNADIYAKAYNTVQLNDFYDRVGLRTNEAGNIMGFDSDHKMNIEFRSRLLSDGRVVLLVDYSPVLIV